MTKTKILYGRGVVRKLMKEFGVSDNTVRQALKFVTEGEQPEAIRRYALKYLGCKVAVEKILLDYEKL